MTETEAARAARPFSTNSVIHSLSEVPRSAASDLTCRSISSGRSYVARMAMLFHEHIVASTHALGPRPSPGAPFIPWDRARPRAHPSCPPLPRNGRGRPRSQAPLMPWDRARPRAHPSCPPSPRSGRGRPRSQAPHALGPRPSPGAPFMPSFAPQRPRTAALPGTPHALGPRPSPGAPLMPSFAPQRPRTAALPGTPHALPRPAAAEDGRAPRRVEARFLTVSTPVPVPNARLRGPKMTCWRF